MRPEACVEIFVCQWGKIEESVGVLGGVEFEALQNTCEVIRKHGESSVWSWWGEICMGMS